MRYLQKSMFIAKAREDDNIRKFVTGNVFGITFSESSFEGNDICLRVHYQMKFPVSLLGKKVILALAADNLSKVDRMERRTWHPGW